MLQTSNKSSEITQHSLLMASHGMPKLEGSGAVERFCFRNTILGKTLGASVRWVASGGSKSSIKQDLFNCAHLRRGLHPKPMK